MNTGFAGAIMDVGMTNSSGFDTHQHLMRARIRNGDILGFPRADQVQRDEQLSWALPTTRRYFFLLQVTETCGGPA